MRLFVHWRVSRISLKTGIFIVIFGGIEIADGCYIGANAVVNRSVLEPNSVILGVPGKVVKHDTRYWWEYNGMEREK